MSLGYIIILFIRDPFKVYLQDLLLTNSNKDTQQILLSTMDLSRKIVRAIISLCFTALLIKYPMILVISLLTILSIIEIFVSIYLYKLVKKSGVN